MIRPNPCFTDIKPSNTLTWVTSGVSRVCQILFVSIGLVISLSPSALAQTTADQQSSEPLIIEFIPYAWAAGLSGEVSTLPGLPPVSIDLPFSDVLEDLDFAFMGVAIARKGRFGLFSDIVYSELSASASFPEQEFAPTANVSASTLIITAGGLYRPIETETGSVDLLAGVRYWDLNTRITLGAGTLGSLSFASDQGWIDPTIGVRGRLNLGERFTLGGTGLIAGSDGGSDFTSDLWVTLGYEWNDRLRTILGYRRLDVDYDDGDFLYDVTQDGALLGISLQF